MSCKLVLKISWINAVEKCRENSHISAGIYCKGTGLKGSENGIRITFQSRFCCQQLQVITCWLPTAPVAMNLVVLV